MIRTIKTVVMGALLLISGLALSACASTSGGGVERPEAFTGQSQGFSETTGGGTDEGSLGGKSIHQYNER
jgi:hypothetical protein